jgi:hypothetical protein
MINREVSSTYHQNISINLTNANSGDVLRILVENGGRNAFWTIDDRKVILIYKDRHAFSELDIFMGKTPQKRFRIEICAIRNPIVKNRIKNGFSYQKIVLEKEAK